jgi:F-type H+-transporting ATPase subunit d
MYEHHCYWSEWCFQLKEIQGFVKQSSARIVGYEAEVARLKSLLPYEQMTMEDFKDAYPDQVS